MPFSLPALVIFMMFVIRWNVCLNVISMRGDFWGVCLDLCLCALPRFLYIMAFVMRVIFPLVTSPCFLFSEVITETLLRRSTKTESESERKRGGNIKMTAWRGTRTKRRDVRKR